MGRKAQYSFDIWIDPSFSYPGYGSPHAAGFLADGWDSELRIASWEGPLLHNFLYMLKVDNRHGIGFLVQPCQPRDKFGTWVSFSMTVLWSSSKDGWIEVKCDDKIIYKSESVATNQAPHCYITNQCEPGIYKNPRRVLFILGPVMAGFGHDWKKYGLESPFTTIQSEGITIKMRRVSVSE